MIGRMVGAAALRPDTFEDIEADESATHQATWVVIIMALATGIEFFGLRESVSVPRGFGSYFGIVFGCSSWVSLLATAWGAPLFLVGGDEVRQPEWGKLVRSTGYAQSPGVFKLLGLISGARP